MRSTEENIKNCINEQIIQEGSFTLKEISDKTGYTTTTIAKYVNELRKEGRIEEQGKDEAVGRGRKTVRYCLSRSRIYYLGVNVRMDSLGLGLMDLGGKLIRHQQVKGIQIANNYSTLEKICESVIEFVNSTEGVSMSEVAAAGVNLLGRVNSKEGTSATMLNIEDTIHTPLADILSEKIGVPVYLENETRAMTYGEYILGLKRKYQNVCFLNVGMGLGLGLIFNGELYYGKDGYSGEFGHMHTYNNNILCHCGKKGCLETEVSGRAIIRKVTERIKKGESSVLSSKVRMGNPLTLEDILDAVGKEDSLTMEIVGTVGQELGRQLSGAINLLNPEVIVIGGLLSQIDRFHFQQYISLGIHQYALKLLSKDVPITKSTLGPDATILGACLIARERSTKRIV